VTPRQTALIVTPSIDTRMGGVERFARSLESALSNDWDVSLQPVVAGTPLAIEKLGGRFLWESRHAARETATRAGDLVITNGTLGWGIPPSRSRIHVFHGTLPAAMRANSALPLRERFRSGIGGGLAERLSAGDAVTVAVSESAAEDARRTLGISVRHVIENGVDCDLFRPRDRTEARRRLGLPESGHLAMFVGRAEPRKGADLALRAAESAGMRLVVAGAREVQGAIHLGLLSPDALAWAYSAADCVVFPTRYEACSYVVLEALAAGVPLITTPVGWARHLFRRVPAYRQLQAAPDVAALHKAIERVRAGGLGEAITAARRMVVEHNSSSIFARQWRMLAAACRA